MASGQPFEVQVRGSDPRDPLSDRPINAGAPGDSSKSKSGSSQSPGMSPPSTVPRRPMGVSRISNDMPNSQPASQPASLPPTVITRASRLRAPFLDQPPSWFQHVAGRREREKTRGTRASRVESRETRRREGSTQSHAFSGVRPRTVQEPAAVLLSRKRFSYCMYALLVSGPLHTVALTLPPSPSRPGLGLGGCSPHIGRLPQSAGWEVLLTRFIS